MKLNVGSGYAKGRYKAKEWVNVDLHRNSSVNVQGDMFQLPFADNSFEEVHSIHVLEHLTRDKHLLALKELLRITALDGKCYVEVPDFEEITALLTKAYENGSKEAIHKWRTSIYGKTERPGMSHHFGFDYPTLKALMDEAGFRATRVYKREEMVSEHYAQEPILLLKGTKQ